MKNVDKESLKKCRGCGNLHGRKSFLCSKCANLRNEHTNSVHSSRQSLKKQGYKEKSLEQLIRKLGHTQEKLRFIMEELDRRGELENIEKIITAQGKR